MSSLLLAVLIVVSIADLVSGSYQGAVWWLCGAAGIIAGGGAITWLVRVGRNPGPISRPLQVILTVLSVAPVIALRSGFPHGQYSGAGEFFNLLRAGLVGYGIAYWAMVEWYLVRAIPRARPRPQVVRGKAGPDSAEMKVRLRFPGTDPAGRLESGVWRRGRLIAASGTVTWVSRKNDVPVDLTGASVAPGTPPSGGLRIPPRTTTLMTAQGPVEIAVTPAAVAPLFPAPAL